MMGRLSRAGFFALLPAFGVGGALGAPVLLCLAGAASLQPSLLRQAVENRRPALLSLLVFLGLSIGSLGWSAEPAAPQALKIAILAPLGLVFAAAAAADPRMTRAGGVAAFAVLAALLSIEALWGLPLNRAAQPTAPFDELLRNTSRASSLLLALTWPAAAMLMARGKRFWTGLGLAALAAGGFVSLQFGQSANALAFAVGLVAFLAAFVIPRFALGITIGALIAWLLAAPFATPAISQIVRGQSLPYSWNARLDIWAFICDGILEQPWIGHGLDAARALGEEVPVHPHSASLQIWYETGALGALVAAGFMLFGAIALSRRVANNGPAAAAAAGTIAALGVVANLSFNLWAEWWFATFFIAAGLVGALIPERK